MTTLRKLFSKKKVNKLKNNILDFDFRKLLVIKSLLILIFISLLTFSFIFYSFLFPVMLSMHYQIHPSLAVIAWIVLFFPSLYLFRKFKSNFIAVKEEYKAKGYFKILLKFFKKYFNKIF